MLNLSARTKFLSVCVGLGGKGIWKKNLKPSHLAWNTEGGNCILMASEACSNFFPD